MKDWKSNKEVHDKYWGKLYDFISKNIDSSNIKVVIGNLNDLKLLYLFRSFLNKLGIYNVNYDIKNTNVKINNDYTNQYLFNTNIYSI